MYKTMKPVNPVWLLVFATFLSVVQCDFKLQIVHTNDMHSRFQETNVHSGQCVHERGACYGGFARLKTTVEETKAKGKSQGYNPIFLNAGDTYQGTIFYSMFKWRIVVDMINMLKPDVLSLGNHEFDDGPAGLTPFVVNATVPFVSANIDYSQEPALNRDDVRKKLTPSHVLDVAGVKIGVIGYLTPDTQFLSQPGKVKFEDEVVAIKREVANLKSQGIKILIAVGHSGYKTDKRIAAEVPDIDIVVGGHTNTFLWNGNPPSIEKIEGPYPTVVVQPSGRKVYTVQAYAYTKYLGDLRITFDDEGEVKSISGQPILVTESFKQDPDVQKEIQKYADEMNATVGRQIGFSRPFLEADAPTCRLRECNFANLATDAIVYENARDHAGKGWTDAPIGLMQGGTFRASIDTELSKGVITYSNLLTTLPFINSLERIKIPGVVMMQILEHSVVGYDPQEKRGAFMQFSGMHVAYDLSNPPGKRVLNVSIRCGDCDVPQYHPFDSSSEYQVVTTSYLADGGDGYSMLKDLPRTVLSQTDVGAVETYLGRSSPVYPEIQGRITLVGVPSGGSSLPSTAFTTLACLGALNMLTRYVSNV